MKNMAYSIILISVVALLIIIMLSSMAEAHDKDYRRIVAKWCSQVERPKGDQALRHAGLNALQYAIDQYKYDGLGSTPDVNCVTDPAETFYRYKASVKCRGYKGGPPPSGTECYNCLYNAQYRLVDKVCPEKVGGQIELKNCVLAYYDFSSNCPGEK